MYLKSLELKGFKSFADRVSLTLEPGITAIVGPNGSGKSNISDAVLWVLGERSARNLRGQAMEDIIFSGSAARKAVSVAEVALVLDNSDGTIPVEFDEVTVARRMYRSGESEYLVNGVVSRRLDVLEILHDSGLGTGTHSIISQGSLDSILQSRPEDRRALIEEAAGVLKHKQRKEKSARKLDAMDHHLERVRDVTAEVERQLGPLERKAKRAKAYEEASAKLAELRLAIAVDDLRQLQVSWDDVCERERKLVEEVEQCRSCVTAAEQKVNDFQELIRRESQDAGELARRQRRVANLAERMDSAEMLVRERRRAALAYEADTQAVIDGSAERRDEALRELESAREQLAQALAEAEEANTRAEALSARRSELERAYGEAERAAKAITASLRRNEGDSDKANRELANLQESLSTGLAHMKLVEARKAELMTDLNRARDEHAEAERVAREARETLEDLQRKDKEAQEALVSRFTERDEARQQHDAAREARHLLDTEAKAIEQTLRAERAKDPALLWLLDNAERFTGGLTSVSRSLKVKGSCETLVESLLGEDLGALSVENGERAVEVAEALAHGNLSGDVSLVLRTAQGAAKVSAARASSAGTALIDELTCSEAMQPVIEALLGDVVLCENRGKALAAHESDKQGLRFASPDGFAIWPTGKVRVYGARDGVDEGVLSQERHLDEVREKLEEARVSLERAQERQDAAEEAYREAQAASLKLNEKLASHKGTCSAAITEEERAAKRLSSISDEIEDIASQFETARLGVDELRPQVDETKERIEQLAAERSELLGQRDAKADEVQPLRQQLDQVAGELSEAKLARATLTERKTYAKRIVEARERDIRKIDEDVAESRRSLHVKRVAVQRGAAVLEIVSKLAGALQRRMRLLDEAVSASESSSSSVHAQAATAREEARAAHNAFDDANERRAQVRIEKSRLEVQVGSAVERVTSDCSTPIDQAEQLPPLENRGEVEDEMFKLERRIRNMGAINPDAAEEYAALKERYDFLAGQLADMESARRSLNRIVRVIDARMKDDFVKTFEQVNENFSEVFTLLFPGGNAHLSLVDPEDVENTGVEVTAQPRGKRLTKMMLMSGGEKSLTALALLFAVYKTRATPFYILDEVEAALDDTNLRRLIAYINSLRDTTQLIMITHQRRTMEMADVLFGVSMQADGVTKVISQKLERALEQAE